MSRNRKVFLFMALGIALIVSVAILAITFFQMTRSQVSPPLSVTDTSTPNNLSASQVIIASQGGSVELSDGTRVDIPADALESDTRISISIPSQLDDEITLPKNSAALIREISASDVSLKRPIRLTFSYTSLQHQESLSPDTIFVARWDGDDWQYLGGDIDSQRKMVTVETDHLSIFGVFDLPSLDALFSGLKSFLSTCTPNWTTDLEWTQLVSVISQANSGVVSIQGANVYLRGNFGTFAASEGGYIFADRTWFEREADWLPASQRNLLVEPILAHELSHIVRGSTNIEVTSLVLKEALGGVSVNDFMREMGAYLMALSFAVSRGDCDATLDHLNTLVFTLPRLALMQSLQKDTCAKLQQLELTADEDGVGWASHYSGEINAIGLVFSHWLQKRGGDDSCTHPSGFVRAQQIRAVLAMGSDGGVFGQVVGIGGSLSDVTITIDNQITEWTDENGQFLITGLFVGTHTITYSKPDYQSVTLSVEVPFQDLVDTSTELLWLPATPTAAPTDTPFPQLATISLGPDVPLLTYDSAEWEEHFLDGGGPTLDHRVFTTCHLHAIRGLGGQPPDLTFTIRIGSTDYIVDQFGPADQPYLRVYSTPPNYPHRSNVQFILLPGDTPGDCIEAAERVLLLSDASINQYSGSVPNDSGPPPSRVAVGMRARVSYSNGLPIRLRESPGLSGRFIMNVAEGVIFWIIGGPEYQDNSPGGRFS